MNKEWFNEQLADIEVPRDEVFTAIHTGIMLGKKEIKKTKKKIQPRKIAFISSIAASLLILSGFIFQPITKVLASVPILGAIYDDFNNEIGKKLEANGDVSILNEKVTNNGVDVTVTSSYFDGNNIGITFKADGKGLSNQLDPSTSPEAGYAFQLKDGIEEKQQLSGSREQLKKNGDSYIGAMTLEYPQKKLPANFNLPLTFTYMGGKKGNWSFNIPVKQLPIEKIISNGESISKDRDYSIKMVSVLKGKATTIMNYQTKLLNKNDVLRLKVYDDHKKRLTLMQAENERAIFNSVIDKKANYLLIYPEFSRNEDETIKRITKRPFTISSKRFAYLINVEKVEKDNQQVIIDYKLKNINSTEIRKDLIQNFADSIKLIKSKDVKDGLKGQALFDSLKNDSIINAEKAKLLNKNEYQFQSTFYIKNSKEFDYNDYSLMIPFGLLGVNSSPIKLDPIKVELKSK